MFSGIPIIAIEEQIIPGITNIGEIPAFIKAVYSSLILFNWK